MNFVLQIVFLALGFFLLVKGADWFVDGASGLARKLGIPQLVIGLTIVAMGTSLPEAAVSISAGTTGKCGDHDWQYRGKQYFKRPHHPRRDGADCNA